VNARESASFDEREVLFEEGHAMRTTVALDDYLIAEAQALTGLKEKIGVAP
jgi:Arc/MetJ family transcription regulator